MILSKSNAITAVQAFPTLSLLVVGDIMLDEFHWCTVSRISPEAPVPVCNIKSTTLCLGGAANVAGNIQTLGSQVMLCGFIGNDSTGNKLCQLLNDQHISTHTLHETSLPTILKSRILAQQQHVTRLDREPLCAYDPTDHATCLQYISSCLDTIDAIILSDYNKGVLTPSFTETLILQARQRNKPVFVDPKGKSFLKYKHANYITPNFNEFCIATGKEHTSEASILDSACTLIDNLSLEGLVITRSEKGMSIVKDNTIKHIPTHAKEVFDITGAGDTVMACLALGLAAGLSIDNAASLANYAAGIVVTKLGTSMLQASELTEKITSDTHVFP